ncbi:DNA (cytosine-5)-methyltransferase CMT3 isoform X2 [Morus notabilis]|uniref:DNA (cytosine-5)-methyltransferase CMT3 isoform X2 n=1 Tax=Morus notabilis TaxID=981085 RepID=UPI000CECFDEE|nr:DNA (cytosine-5)-methyltransferase CMT3 isoform X2 [Morus notabilis]
MRPPRKSKAGADSSSKALVLYKTTTNDAQPVPLSVYYPRSPCELSLRRSPRLAPIPAEIRSRNLARNAGKKFDSVDPNSLRKSPRFAPSPAETRSGNVALNVGKKSDSLDPNSLRKSPRFASSPEEINESNLTPKVGKKLYLVDPNCLRRSPRFGHSLEEVKSSNMTLFLLNKNFDLVEDPNSRRRSPRFGSSLEEVKSSNVTPKVSKNPDLVDANSMRRSPRFGSSLEEVKSSNVTPKLGKKLYLVDSNSMRRSPRFSPSAEEVKASNVASKMGKKPELVDPKIPNSLRRSARFSPSAEGDKESNVTPKVSKKPNLVDRNSLRRSARFSSSPEAVTENNAANKRASMALRSCLRSQPISSAPIDSSEFRRKSKKLKSDSGNCDSEVFNKKSLRRSGRFPPPVVVADSGEKKSPTPTGKGSKGQNLTTIEGKEAISSNLDCSKEKYHTRSTRSTSTQSGTESSCLESKNLENQKKSFIELESLSREEDCGIAPKPLKYNDLDFSGEECLRASNLMSMAEHNTSEYREKVYAKMSNEKDMASRFSSGLATDESIGLDTFDKLSDSSDESDGPLLDQSTWTSSKKFDLVLLDDQEEYNFTNFPEPHIRIPTEKTESRNSSKNKKKNPNISFFIGDPIPDDEAQERWHWRYELKNQQSKHRTSKLNDDDEDKVVLNVECHFAQAQVGNCIFSLGDCAHIQGDGKKKHVGRIVEFFKTTDGEKYFRVQWFYPIEDTVVQDVGAFHDKRRLFYSTIRNDNLLDCIISKVHVTKITPRVGLKINSISPCDFYYDMEYCVDYSTFQSIESDNSTTCGIKRVSTTATETHPAELALLDLYSGCGGMSTGLCLGAKISGVNLVTRWALDSSKSACESLKLNHPDTNVRNEAAEDFIELLKEWEKLCKRYRSTKVERTHPSRSKASRESENDDELPSDDEFEVSRFVDICYGDPAHTGKRGLKFKVHWKGYGTSEDSWEPVEGLSNCREKIEEFVRDGMKRKILPLPADVDVICGGPPCQGISGYNRFRNVSSPLDDDRNRQIVVFMDIVNFLKPKYVLMENVVDIMRLDKGSLGRYALSRLVHMNYQARLGIIAAGCYGLPQFRLRVFLWGALPHENLPQFPLPTHDVIVRYWPPPEFERNTVAYDEDQPRELEKALVLQDAISDLPPVTHDETREEISYSKPPETEFQRYIRSTKLEMAGSALNDTRETKYSLYDHRPTPFCEDDYLRVCKIPKRKGANFRNLPGVIVGGDNVARRDPNVHILLPSGKPLVPDYTFTFEKGKSKRPFSRLWWDETVPTVLTIPCCHNQAALHPEQDRILTLREYARLQGFPDYYRFCGTLKARHRQVGNAVPVNVARALGYALGLAARKLSSNEPLLTLPNEFSLSNFSQLANNNVSQE